jgi:tetratricopeptide (TPR) repeat protein
MTTQVPAWLAPFPWAARLQSRLCSQPLAAQQRRALERSLQAQSITVAVRSLTSSVGYAAMPSLEEVGHLRVHPLAGVVTTPGGFRVSLRQGQALLQGPNGLWTELEAELPAGHAARRHPLIEQSVHVLLPDGTRLTLQHQAARALRRVLISRGNQHLAADTAHSGPAWQPVQRSPQLARWEAQPDGTRYAAMIDDGLLRHTLKVRARNRLMAWGALFLEETPPPPEIHPMSHATIPPQPPREPTEQAPRLDARLQALLQGEATLSDLSTLTREELYELAGHGHNLYDAGQIDAARKVFESLTALDPNEAFFHSGLGAIYQHQGELERAIAEYDRALFLNERDIPARCNRAEVLLQQGHTEAAIRDLERISELDPGAQCSHTLRARSIALTLLTLADGNGEPRQPSR